MTVCMNCVFNKHEQCKGEGCVCIECHPERTPAEPLTQGCYGNQFSGKPGRFGLRCGQMRPMKGEIGNAGWYNKNGEKLGFGDLGLRDFKHIADGLREDEIFVVLAETDSFWAFVDKVGMIGSMCQTKPTEQVPGKEYVAAKARYVIMEHAIYYVGDSLKNDGFVREGIPVGYMNRETLADLLDVDKKPKSFFQQVRDWF